MRARLQRAHRYSRSRLRGMAPPHPLKGKPLRLGLWGLQGAQPPAQAIRATVAVTGSRAVCRADLLALSVLLGLAGCSTSTTFDRERADRDAPSSLVVRPVGSRPETTRVRLELKPLGTLRYDGQTLPLVSPTGEFLAVQQREEPTGPSAAASGGNALSGADQHPTEQWAATTWAAALAQPFAEAPANVSIVFYNLRTPEPFASNQGVTVALPPGCILGRSADARGFLIERLLDDGSRWIGLVSWLDASVRWLVADEHHNAMATLGPSGELCWVRTRAGTRGSELVLRPDAADRRDERRARLPDTRLGTTTEFQGHASTSSRASTNTPASATPLFPVFSGERSPLARNAYVKPHTRAEGLSPPTSPESERATSPQFLGLWCVALESGDDRTTARLLLVELAIDAETGELVEAARSPLAGASREDAALAFSCVQTPWPQRENASLATTSTMYAGLLCFDASMGGMCWRESALRATPRQPLHAIDAQTPLRTQMPEPALIAPQSLGAAALVLSSTSRAAFVVGEPDALCFRTLVSETESLSHTRGAESASGDRRGRPSPRTELLRGSYLPWLLRPAHRHADSALATPPTEEFLLLAPPSKGEDSAMIVYLARPAAAVDATLSKADRSPD